MVSPASPTRRLADLLLGRPVEEWISERRLAGRSWRLIERDLRETTEGEVDVTHETLRSWCPDDPAPKAAAS